MQVSNQPLHNQLLISDSSIELKQGEVYRATIKERLTENEALIQIRGKDQLARFEDGVPAGNRVTVLVNDQKDQIVNVKTIATENTKMESQLSSEEKILKSIGLSGKETAGLKQAVQILLDKGSPLSKEVVSDLKEFMDKANGPVESKIETVKALANKRLEATQTQLRAIHEALHGKPLNEVLSDIAKEIDPKFKLESKEAITGRQQEQSVQKETSKIVHSQSIDVKASSNIGTKDNTQSQPLKTGSTAANSQLTEVIQKGREIIEKEPDLKKAIQQIREEIIKNPKIDRELAQKIEKAAAEAEKLQTIGKDRLLQALKSAEEQLLKKEQPPTQLNTSINQSRLTTSTSQEVQLANLVKELNGEVSKDPNILRSIEKIKDQLIENPRFPKEIVEKVSRAVNEAATLVRQGRITTGKEVLSNVLSDVQAEVEKAESNGRQSINAEQQKAAQRPSEVVREVKAEVQREPDLLRAVEKVREQVVNHPKIDRETAQKIEKALNEVAQLQKNGQESAGRERLQQALTKAETELKQIEGRQQTTPSQSSQPTSARTEADSKQPEVQIQKQEQDTQLRDSIKQVREQVITEPDMKKILRKVQEEISNNKKIDPELARNIERLANQANQLDQAGRERLIKMLQQVEAALKQNETQTETLETSTNANQKEQSTVNNQQQNSTMKNPEITDQTKQNEVRPSELIKLALQQLKKEPNLELALQQVRKEITSNPSIDMKTIDRAEKALNHATQLQDKGREMAARQHITKELAEVEQDLAKTEPKINQEQKLTQDQYDLNEQLQSLSIQSKDILVTKVTQKLAQATHDFRELKREITRNLDNVQRLIDTYKNNAYPQAKQMLETAISKLDNAILKSEMMLFTDMKTEKQLMHASSQLADAKKLLAKGEHSEASKIVSDVKSLIDKVIFKPTEQKVMHFVNKESMALENRSAGQQMLAQYGHTASSNMNQEPSARQMFEMVRSLGLNHDSDVANSLVFQKNEQSQQEQQQQQNLKAALLKLAQGEEANSKVAQQAEQALTNLTGQQLLSKSDASGTLQSMFFNLPMLLGGKPENLQVFVNSKNEGQQVDWENCNLYFLLETRKLGDVGILLNSTDRNLSITIKNDLPGFKERMEPLASLTKEKLQEVGYNVNSINFTRMSTMTSKSVSHEKPENQSNEAQSTRPVFTEKGMDFKI